MTNEQSMSPCPGAKNDFSLHSVRRHWSSVFRSFLRRTKSPGTNGPRFLIVYIYRRKWNTWKRCARVSVCMMIKEDLRNYTLKQKQNQPYDYFKKTKQKKKQDEHIQIDDDEFLPGSNHPQYKNITMSLGESRCWQFIKQSVCSVRKRQVRR